MRQDRFSPSFRPDLLPRMYSMPIGVIPKPHSSDLRLITDHSTGKHAFNNFITRADASIKLDGLQDFCVTLHTVLSCHGRPPSWLFKSNISAAYRRIPMHPLWQIKQINTFKGLRHVDRNMAFRSHSTPRIWCTFFMLVMWIAIYVCICADLMHY